MLCKKHGKVPGVLLGDHRAAALYESLGMQFIGIGSDLMVMMERAAAAVEKQRANETHAWSSAPVDCAPDKARSDAFWDLLRRRLPFAGSILGDGRYELIRAARPAPVVLIDCFREGLDTPVTLSRALRSLDGPGHRLVRIISADPKDTPMTAAVALALGARIRSSFRLAALRERAPSRPRALTKARAGSISDPSSPTNSPKLLPRASSSSTFRLPG